MKDKILTLIHTDARFVKGCTSLSMQRCFAIKADINELLDVARQIYCELISDMKSKRIIYNVFKLYRYPTGGNHRKLLRNFVLLCLNRHGGAVSRKTQASIILRI